MMNVLMIIAQDNFRDEEYDIPRRELESSGIGVSVASPSGGLCRGMLGMTVESDMSLGEAHASGYDAVIVVGGSGSPKWLWGDGRLHKILSDAVGKSSVVAAICLSTGALAKAGILAGVKATVFPSPDAIRALKEGNAVYVQGPVVSDGRIVTARGPESAREFACEIIRLLKQ
ncbi:MAG: DJ-1/PfpI family protein [Candidatus Altiarchaeota archaeon]